MKIYLVTTIHLKEELTWQHRIVRKRCVGYFPDFETADRCVRENWGDIYENGHYNHVVIEGKEPGLYSLTTEEHWYHWDRGIKGYLGRSKPDTLKSIVHFGMG